MNSPEFNLYQIPIIRAPGVMAEYRTNRQIIRMGRQLRDEDLWKYPHLPSAVFAFQQYASAREWRIVGSKEHVRGISRAIEYINSSVTKNYYNSVNEEGFEQFLMRLSMDYICIGRVMFHWGEGKPMEYVDPAEAYYSVTENNWLYFNFTKLDNEHMIIHHPIPLGGHGYFTAPLNSVIPTAILAYLIREYDTASLDGRRVRDIYIVGSEEMADQIVKSIKDSANNWSGADPTKYQIPIVFVDTLNQMPVKDMIHRIGLANIPDNFDRKQFNYLYQNEIANALGLALRQIWSGEEGTNRALEEIQEARQSIKGPAVFLRSIERKINRSGMLKQFSPNIRFEVVEEIDVSTRMAKAEVLEKFANAARTLSELDPTKFKLENILAWGAFDGIFEPNLLSLFNQHIQKSDSLIEKTFLPNEKTLDYGEVSYDLDGKKIESRNRIFHITNELKDIILHEPKEKDLTVNDFINEARRFNADLFLEKFIDDEDVKDFYVKVYNEYDSLNDEQHNLIYNYVSIRS